MQKFIVFSLIVLALVSCSQNDERLTETESRQEVPKGSAGMSSPLDSITQVINEQGATAERLVDRAQLYLIYENISAAKNDINQALALDSNFAELYEVRGEMNFMQNKTREAKIDWEKCLRLHPENSVCIMQLAELMIAVQNYDRALELVNQQLEIDNNDAQAYFMKGIIIRDKHEDIPLALQYFQNAIDIKQDYIDALDMMAITLARRGDTLAKFYYERILEFQPNNSEVYFKLGVFYQEQDEINRAIEAYTKATQLNPRDANSYYNLGYIHVELDLYQQAREYFTKAIENQDRPYNAHYGRGYTYEVVGDLINARKDYRKAIEILPMYKPAQEALTRINTDLNNQN